jgi:hypothetical protein
MEFCPECGCKLEFTRGVIMCTNCNYSECNCPMCSSQDEVVDVQTVVEEFYSKSIELKGENNHVEQTE